jgi:hypothetical protein
VLQCPHTPCLGCASGMLLPQEEQGPAALRCSLCSSLTELANQSVLEILGLKARQRLNLATPRLLLQKKTSLAICTSCCSTVTNKENAHAFHSKINFHEIKKVQAYFWKMKTKAARHRDTLIEQLNALNSARQEGLDELQV